MATGKDVVGADGLTNAERYKKRQEEKAAKAAAEKARIAALDKDRPEGVSRYLWEKVLNGDSNFNKALVSKNPEVSEAIASAGHGDWVKAIHEQSMDQAASHYMGNGADPSAAYATAQNPWYNKNFGKYENTTVSNTGNNELGFGGSTGAPSNPGYVAPEVPTPPPATGGNPGGMFGGLTGAVQDTRPPEATPPGGAITGPTQEEALAAYQEQLAAAQAAQQAAYEKQLAAQQAQYEQQKADAAAARQAEIDRRAAEQAAKQEANKQSWSNANAAAAGVAGGSSSSGYTKKYGQGSNAGGLMAGVNSVKGNPNRAADVLPTGGARPSGPQPGFKEPVMSAPPKPSHQPQSSLVPMDGAMPNGKPSNMGSTPWADAFLRSKKAAEAPGPVSGMMSKWME